jgi:uncharacterized protein YuzE
VKIKYFQDTDTLYIELRQVLVTETRDLDENMLVDLNVDGQVCGIKIEHAKEKAEIPRFSFEQIAA